MVLWNLSVVECHLHIMFLDLMWSVLDVELGENVYIYTMYQRQKNGREYVGENNVLVGGYKFSFDLLHYVEKIRTIY